MTDAIYILNTKVLKDAGYEGSLNDLADNIAENGGVVSGSFEETGEPVMTVYGIEEETLLDLLEEGGVENAVEISEQSRVEDNDDTDFDSELENVDNQDEPDVDEGDDPDENIDNDDPDDEPNDDVDDNFDDTPNDDIDDEGDDDEIIELDDDELDELGDLHTEEEELHDQEEEIHDQEEEIDPDNDEEELHKQEEEIHDEEEKRHDEIEDELGIDTDEIEDEELDENKKHRGTQNLSESVTHDIINRVKDAYILKRIQDRAEVIDKLNESCKNITVNMNPWSNVVVNGTPIWKYRNLDIVDMINESKSSYKELYKKYKSLNESHSRKKDIVKALKKQKKLIEILESEALFRNINKKNTKINEEQEISADAALENNDNSNDQSQEATLTSIVFKVKNADEFIKVLTDNGIPAEALKKGTTDESNTDDNKDQEQNDQQSQEMPPMDNSMSGGGAPAGAPAPAAGANPFESVTTRLTKNNKLNEAGNPFDELAGEGQESASLGDSDQPGPIDGVDPLNADEAQSAGEGEEVILTDTQYAAQVQKILEDVYGYSKKDFEDKIGGEIQGSEDDGSDGDNIFNDADGSDDGSENVEEDDATTGKEESISPEDIFSDLPGGL